MTPNEGGTLRLLDHWIENEKQQQKKNSSFHQPRGVTFRNVDVNGYVDGNSFQRTFASYIQLIPTYLKALVGCKTPKQQVKILRSIDGLVSPGEMLLVLGRPGSGCTTFLKTMSGCVNGVEVVEKQGGGIFYDGIPFSEMHKRHWAETIYLAEEDVHLPELTLEETLAFAASMRSHAEPTEVTSRQTASIYGLQRVLTTRVGNDRVRGLSGGEKRRTSIAEAFLSVCPIQCCDNSIRGLDSATALNVVRTMRHMTRAINYIVMTTIYQAPEALYCQFDKVLLLHQGRQVYFGATQQAASYFERLGFIRADGATTADFLTSLTNPAEHVVRPGFEASVPRTADEFAEIWQHSPECLALKNDIVSYNEEHSQRTISGSSYPTKLAHQINVCISRAFLRSRHNMPGLISGIVGNTILAIILGSMFYNLPEDTSSFESRSILIFYCTMLNACLPAFEVNGLWAQRPVVEKQSRYAFYHPVAEAIASMISDLPVKVLTSLFFNVPIYFLTNLRRAAPAFFTFWLFGLVVMVTMSGMFRSVGSISRTYAQSLAPVTILIFNFLIYAGFVIPTRDQVPWLSWIRYFNPIAFTNESLMINEFRSQQYSCASFFPAGPSYQTTNIDSKICLSVGSVPGQSWVDGDSYLLLKYGYHVDHLWRNFGILLTLMAGFSAIHLVAAECMQAQRSKGDITIFRRSRGNAHLSPVDEEAVNTDLALVQNEKIGRATFASENIVAEHYANQHSSVFSWSNLGYDVQVHKNKEPLRILEGIDGWVNRGTLTALMGSTGAGKTTLLDVLANRKSTGNVYGEVRIDGRPRDGCFQRKTGYVQQSDIHLQTATVREALEFSALLRQSKYLTRAEKLAYVDTVLQMLEMESYSEAIVGVPGMGLNIEQRKRLTIAVEMAARPELLFLDEPTSGLDSQTAWSICTLLRKLSNYGQPILCTIHQPSAELFQMFDRLLFLQEGKTLYFGDLAFRASTLIDYLTRGGARSPSESENPAEWLLEVTASPPSGPVQDWASVWKISPECKAIKDKLSAMGETEPSAPTLPALVDDSEYAASKWAQLQVVTYRMFQDYWREPTYLYSKIALCVGAGLFDGLSFWMLDHTVQGLTSSLFSCFLLTIIFNTVDQQIIPRFIDGRQIFEARERQSKTYSWPVFVTANIIVEIFWQSLTALPVFVAWYYPTGFWRNGLDDNTFGMNERAALMFLLIWLFLIFSSTLP
ncbi:hypothetical protein N7456_001322 [Penicillium angulare]|uniref:ABC transporter domain-containing protein n=1 Tax=Penicillium angulare TaxID=116970 RepID=A0A9W9KT36_9EURO|nr:hypothetical protein N7456_001322 [Penicillium angulare]